MSSKKKYSISNMKSAGTEPKSDIFGGINIFSVQDLQKTNEKPSMIRRGDLIESPKNPYRVDENSDDMTQLVASIKENGILTPLLARPMGTKYEIISGHRRKKAADILEMEELPVFVRDLSDEEADRIMVDMNLNRENILPSEKAKAIKLKYDAIKRSKGRKRADDTSKAHDSAKVIADEMGMSDRTIQFYLRLTDLSDYVMDAVDSGQIPIKAGVQLSYLPKKAQVRVVTLYMTHCVKITEDVARLLREMHDDKDRDGSKIEKEALKMIAPKKGKRIPAEFPMSKKVKKKYFPETMTDSQIDEVVRGLLSQWAKEHNPDYKA